MLHQQLYANNTTSIRNVGHDTEIVWEEETWRGVKRSGGEWRGSGDEWRGEKWRRQIKISACLIKNSIQNPLAKRSEVAVCICLLLLPY